jgi:hypothetical protein
MSALVEIGDRYGELVVLRRGEPSNGGFARWHCKCDCGGATLSWQSELRRGKTTSCGHGRRASLIASRTSHGHGGYKHTPEYASWSNMWTRCTNPKVDAYKNYGARGITICARWKRFENFFADMGPKPSIDHTIERRDVNRGYCSENCYWTPKGRQSRNRRNNIRVKISGEEMCLAEAARVVGIKYGTVRGRIRNGQDAYKALGIHNGH